MKGTRLLDNTDAKSVVCRESGKMGVDASSRRKAEITELAAPSRRSAVKKIYGHNAFSYFYADQCFSISGG